jgi:ABC-type multidrug transport system ATPase subunit/ABC-type multidrug transport system permease subunit
VVQKTNAEFDPYHLASLTANTLAGSALRVGEPAYLGWSNVSFTLAPKAVKASGKDPQILKNLSGSAKPGEVVALMGASGCGKTSLMNVLSGRATSMGGHVVEANLTVNGKAVTPAELGPKVAYVMQEDSLTATATPREAFDFSARLRLPPSVTADERRQMVEEMIRILHLEGCADTMIGNELIKGISGGEKKRVSIGVELITQPSILFLDEPTSGLDSFAAYSIISTLKDLARLGCTVISTIHQPSSEVFHMFDRVMLLTSGRLLFDGAVDGPEGMSAYFRKVGLPVPEETNPADHVMFLMQTLPVERKTAMADAFAATHGAAIAKAAHSVPGDIALRAQGHSGGLCREQAGLGVQFVALGQREFQNVIRDKASLGARFGSAVVLNLIFALIFFRVGDTGENDYDMMSHFGAVMFAAISAMFGSAQPIILLFPSERPLFVREYATGTYSAVAYFWSKLVMELPLSLTTALITFLTCYWLEALHGNFILHVITMWLLGLAAASVALLAGCVASSAKQAVEATPAIFVPQILFAGFFIKTTQIPVWIRWAQYLCSLKFAVNLHMIIEFGKGSSACDGAFNAKGCAAMLDNNEVDQDLWWFYGLVLCAIFMGFRLLALFLLTRRARGFALA